MSKAGRFFIPGQQIIHIAYLLISLGAEKVDLESDHGLRRHFGSYDAPYGALAAVVLLLIWMYLSSLLVIAGAQLNSELEHQTARDSTEGRAQPLGRRDATVADTVAPQPS